MLHYLLQTLAFQLVFLLVYEIFLKKETFFSYNRVYLLLTPLIALLLPLLNIPQLQSIVPEQTMIMLPEIMLTAASSEASPGPIEGATTAEQFYNWWYLIYGSGIFLSLMLFLNKFREMKNLFRLPSTAEAEDFRIVRVPDSKMAFTFFKTVYVGDQLSEQEKEQILNHEMVHVQQRHSLDLLYFEFLRIVMWFNPLIYIFQARITELHEFIADSGVVKKVEKQTYYQQLLNSAFNTENVSFINQFFNHSLIKKRIVMLQKSRSKAISKMKYLILVPLMLVMLTYVACTEEKQDDQNLSELTQEDQQLKFKLEEELQTMLSNNVPMPEISDAFLTESDQHIKSKESFYRSRVFFEHMMNMSAERKKREGTFNAKEHEKLLKGPYQTYEEYVSYRKNVKPEDFKTEGYISFSNVEQTPVFPGCEDLDSTEAQKECFTNKMTDFVNASFDVEQVKPFAQPGLNRIYVQFTIDESGEIASVKTRASAPELQVEAEEVVRSLPKMIPAKHDGETVGTIYSLPIAFQVEE